MLKTSQIYLQSSAFMGASCAVMMGLLACAPIKPQTIDSAIYEARNANKTLLRATKYSPQPTYIRYGFNGHDLGAYDFNDTENQNVQIFASAENWQLSPYVPPSRGAVRFAPPSLDVSNTNPKTSPLIDHNQTPLLRPRFKHHLDANISAENLEHAIAPVTSPALTVKTSAPKASPPPISQASETPIVNPLTNNPQSHTGSPNNLVINKTEFEEALNARRSGIEAFETAQSRSEKLPIPPLPSDQKQTIIQEQAALANIESKTALAGPHSLRQSLDSAFARSSRLAAESLRVDEAEEVLKQAKARSKPRLEFRSAIGPRQSETTFAFSNTTVSATNLRRSAELDLSLPIYQGGRLNAERASARLGIETARATVSQTRSEIIEDTALAYLNVVRDRELAKLYQQNVDLLKAQQSSAAELLALNETTISEKALIDARLAAQNIRLETGLGVLRESESHYRNLTGKAAPQHLPVPAFNLPFTLTEIQALAQQNNPELTALIHQAKSAEFDVDVAKSGNRPSLALQGILRGAEGQSETIDRNAAAELLLNLRVPISSGGEGQSRVRQAKIVRNRLNLEIRDAQDRLRDQIDSLWARKIASEKNQSFNKSQIEATELAVNIVAEQRAEGVATILDLLNVQQTLLDAKIQTVQARSRQDMASVQLLNFMGLYE